ASARFNAVALQFHLTGMTFLNTRHIVMSQVLVVFQGFGWLFVLWWNRQTGKRLEVEQARIPPPLRFLRLDFEQRPDMLKPGRVSIARQSIPRLLHLAHRLHPLIVRVA